MPTLPTAQQSAWSFVQQASTPGNPAKTLQLTGWSMPFGRPRQGHILDAGIRIRRQITYMPGRGVEPLVNAIGEAFPPLEMHGRWMDQAIGTHGGALAALSAWKDFVNDRRIVLASWNNLIAYRIFIYEMAMKPESPAEVVWEMKADVLSDLSQAPTTTITPVTTPFDMTSQLAALMTPATMRNTFNLGAFASMLDLLNQEIADFIALTIGNLNTQILAVNRTASAIADFVSAPSTALGTLSAGLTSIQANLVALRQSTDTIAKQLTLQQQLANAVGLTTFGFTAAEVITFQSAKIASDSSITVSQALIAAMLAQIQSFQRGKPKTAVVAQQDDTWESIANRVLGSVDGTQALKDMNGIQYGAQPVPGTKYQIPQS